MSGPLKIRLAAFVLGIGLMVVLIAWTAHTSWSRTGELRERLDSVQLESFRIADHFQQTILQLNNSVLRYGAYRDPKDWQQFGLASTNLDRWIDEQSLPPTQEVHGKEPTTARNKCATIIWHDAWMVQYGRVVAGERRITLR